MISVTREQWRAVWSPSEAGSRTTLLLLILSLSTCSCQAAQKLEEPVAVEVLKVTFDHASNAPVVLLQNKEKTKAIPIWVGPFEAQAIAMEMEGVLPPRPMTHDLLKTILSDVGVVFDRVLVHALKDNTYFSRIYLASSGKHLEVDSRPSDAIALALRFRKPIYVARSLMEGQNVLDIRDARNGLSIEKTAGLTVQEVTEQLATYFSLSSSEGVLVTDVKGERAAAGLQRGDVILAVGGQGVRGTGDFKEKIENWKGREVNLRIQREGKEITIKFEVPEK